MSAWSRSRFCQFDRVRTRLIVERISVVLGYSVPYFTSQLFVYDFRIVVDVALRDLNLHVRYRFF